MPAAGAMRTVGVTFLGGATGFTVPGAGMTGAPPSWVTVPTMVDAMNNLRITLGANTGTSARSAMVVFTSTGGMGTSVTTTLTINQLGDVATGPRVTLNPDRLDAVVATGATETVRVTLGGGATGYSVPMMGVGAAASWVTVPAMATGGNVRITIEANPSRRVRRDTVSFAPTGGMGTRVPDDLYISQLGTLPTGPSLTLEPNFLVDLPATGGIFTVPVILGGGATGYTAAGADEWVTVPAMASGNNIPITIKSNTSRRIRTDMVIFTPVGGTGTRTPDTLFISQLGTLPSGRSVTLDPNILMDVLAAGETRTLKVRFGGGASGYTATEADDWVTVPRTSTGGRLSITIAPNTTTSARKDTIVFTPMGGMGVSTVDSLFISQLPSVPAVSYGAPGDIFADVRVVNPVSNDLIVYGLSVSVDATLRDLSGQVVFEGALPAGRRRMALPLLPSGVYLLVLRTDCRRGI